MKRLAARFTSRRARTRAGSPAFRANPALCALLLSAAALPPLAHAQAADEAWNTPRALHLAERMLARRSMPHADSGLTSYRSHASGYVYFYLDGSGSGEPTLAKVSQVALEVYWAAPDLTKQRIVGLRSEDQLPNRMHYHVDHLTVVQNEFDDVIRMGNGDEVRAVPHPAAPGAKAVYDYRLADSLSLRLPGTTEPVRVYEVEVRPRHPDRPAFVGSLFIDRATAAIVRMAFTFTAASYVDPRLDYIRVSLDNGLWDGRYWLPHEQRVEIRRQFPRFDFPVGAVIRAVYRIGDYRLNPSLPPDFFRGSTVVAAPPPVRATYPFTTGLFDGLAQEGLAQPSDLEALRREAAELVGRRYLNGLPNLRLYIPGASSVVRFNRAEGLFLGAGLSYTINPSTGVDVAGGYATGPDHVSLRASVQRDLGEQTAVRADFYRNDLRDLGVRSGAAGLLNTIAAATVGEDYLDPFLASGGELAIDQRLGEGWQARAGIRYEEHRSAQLTYTSAPLDASAEFRPVRPVSEGALAAAAVSLGHTASAVAVRDWHGQLELELGTFDGHGYGRTVLDIGAATRTENGDAAVEVRAAAGLGLGEVPDQRLFLLGGRSTLPGYAYRSFAGDRFALASVIASREVVPRWLRLRALGALGWTDFTTVVPPAGWGAAPTDGVRTSLGLGVGIFYDTLRLDAVRGLTHGDWRVIFSINPDLWGLL